MYFRREILEPHQQRSKYICKPNHVFEVLIHWAILDSSSGTLNVSPDDGILHHYRVSGRSNSKSLNVRRRSIRFAICFQGYWWKGWNLLS